MGEEHESGMDAEQSPEVGDSAGRNEEALSPRSGEESADAVVIYPRGRYVAALRGDVTAEQFATDLISHVRRQLPPRHMRAAVPPPQPRI